MRELRDVYEPFFTGHTFYKRAEVFYGDYFTFVGHSNFDLSGQSVHLRHRTLHRVCIGCIDVHCTIFFDIYLRA